MSKDDMSVGLEVTVNLKGQIFKLSKNEAEELIRLLELALDKPKNPVGVPYYPPSPSIPSIPGPGNPITDPWITYCQVKEQTLDAWKNGEIL